MRRIVIWLASTVTVVVLLFGYHTSTNSAAASGSSVSAPAEPTTAPSSPASASTEPTTTPSSSASKAASATYDGAAADTRWGPVQVEIAVTSGKITGVTLLQQPDGNQRDAEINAQAVPVLVQETLDAQSAKIDMVSGATVTSDGYLQSLQSALDAAGI